MLGKGERAGNPTSDHPSGHAIDFMTSNRGVGDRIAAYARTHAGELGVTYVLWQTEAHYDHVHVSFKRGAATRSC
jgi:hypothetical protein